MLSVRWEEEKYKDGVKWKFLEHNGPYFPANYEPLPDNVHFYYNGLLSTETEYVKVNETGLKWFNRSAFWHPLHFFSYRQL